jgi:hypothetical protein
MLNVVAKRILELPGHIGYLIIPRIRSAAEASRRRCSQRSRRTSRPESLDFARDERIGDSEIICGSGRRKCRCTTPRIEADALAESAHRLHGR